LSAIGTPDHGWNASSFTVTRDPDRIVLALRGDQDMQDLVDLAATLARACAVEERDLVIDLGEVTVIDVPVVHALMRAESVLSASSHALTLRGPTTMVARVLCLCGLADVIDSGDAGPAAATSTPARWLPAATPEA
jgi:anti-anti-sigma factor